ncbi:glycosyltransferase [Microbacterium sp. ASV49]|uniref:Glycosyltransferase n=1 Tax=Microbacterium candidum TaxID=3041922 RepID=A0ABT7MUZ8_9MICO|nr:glycosyltransferase [Microbacterium sp. ASV49]MDL9978279.1 glycosyltransferase [Microbacterium sp. ASV49]
MDLVVMSLEPWDDVWRRNQHLVSRLLDTDAALRVLFVEPAADPLHDVVSRRRPSRGMRVTPAGYGGRLLRFRPMKMLPRRVDPRADLRLARAVQAAVRHAGMTHPFLWVNDPGAAPLARLTGWLALYDITDDWVAADRPAAELDRVRADETWLLAHAEAVVACSRELVRRKSGERPDVVLIPNAVDVDAYRVPHPRPADLPERSAVYVGTLHRDRLDVDLCVSTARTLGTDSRLVLVGPNALDPADTALLRDSGVLLLGARPHDDVIAYLQHADVLVVPHVVTPFTDSLDPIKLYEYEAVGRHVVSTAVAGFREAVGGRIRVVPPSTFPLAAAAAIPASTVFPEGADADVPGWDDRAAAMRAVIDRLS